MKYEIELKPRAGKDLRRVTKEEGTRIADALEALADGLKGDLKRLRRPTMVTMHPSILKRDGREAFAVLPFEEFLRVREELEEYDDLKALRSAKAREHDASSTPLRLVRQKLGI